MPQRKPVSHDIESAAVDSVEVGEAQVSDVNVCGHRTPSSLHTLAAAHPLPRTMVAKHIKWRPHRQGAWIREGANTDACTREDGKAERPSEVTLDVGRGVKVQMQEARVKTKTMLDWSCPVLAHLLFEFHSPTSWSPFAAIRTLTDSVLVLPLLLGESRTIHPKKASQNHRHLTTVNTHVLLGNTAPGLSAKPSALNSAVCGWRCLIMRNELDQLDL